MIRLVHGDRDHQGRRRYALTDTTSDHVWGVCAEVEGLFGDSRRETYELFGWVPESLEARGWAGSRVWLVPTDRSLDPWLLEDVENIGRHPGTDSLLFTGLDDYMGPPEGHRASVRVHDGTKWLGSCREFARVLPPRRTATPLVLRGLAPSARLQRALAKGTRRALELEEARLEIHDDRGGRLTERVLWPKVRTWHPSSHGTHLIDLELDADLAPVPGHAAPVWERWFIGPPGTLGAWTALGTRQRHVWLELVRERDVAFEDRGGRSGRTYLLDGLHITDEPGLHLALGEAVNGPGGYFGGGLDALVDCLRGRFGYAAPGTLLWRDSATAREHLSHTLAHDGEPFDLFATVLDILAAGGMGVILL
ncbi:barstar family protein [Streptomyces sp. NPDC004528]|uniref:barstar family protein n=1 Tax=Streptomyces sp. NPDC004528 TaxID=3154550 RepID=UPI0033B4B1BE